MRDVGVDTRLAVGTVAGAGTIAVMIPPSVLMVIYAIITDQSVAELLIAGIIPGLVAVFWYMVMIYVRCKLNPKLSPQLLERVTWKQRFGSFRHSWGVAVLGLIVMGGIYAGSIHADRGGRAGGCERPSPRPGYRAAKPWKSEGRPYGCDKDNGHDLHDHRHRHGFGSFLGISRIPPNLSDFLLGLNVPRIYILFGILPMYIVAGFFIDMLAFAFLTLPITFPAIKALGYDPLWFGVITVHMF